MRVNATASPWMFARSSVPFLKSRIRSLRNWPIRLLAYAVKLDDNRPADDISVLVLKVVPRTGDDVRRMSIRLAHLRLECILDNE